MFPAIFLDRDGVIIKNRPEYVRTWADVEIYQQSLEALAKLNNTPFKIVIVTNQSGVGRGIIPSSVAKKINAQLVKEIERAGGRIDGVYMCPHAPIDACDCRKPRAGLLLKAAKDLSIELSQSLMIGDALTDVMAGFAANVKVKVLVKTGRGKSQIALPQASDIGPYLVYDTLSDALADLIFG
jgi:histidinol-phosphate phosphatase family protein